MSLYFNVRVGEINEIVEPYCKVRGIHCMCDK